MIVVTEELLESLPDVKMYSGSDTTNIIMSLMEGTDDVYKGSYMFNHSGEHWLRTEIHTSAGIDSVHLRNLEVLLAKTGNDNIIFSPNRDAALQIPKGSIEKDICFTAEQQMIEDSKVFHFGPELEFRSELTLEIDIDRTRFPMLEKLFIYKNVGNEWLRLPSKVYPLNNKIKTNITDLGHFKIMVDSTFSGNNIIPSTYALMQYYPNPFNSVVSIEINCSSMKTILST